MNTSLLRTPLAYSDAVVERFYPRNGIKPGFPMPWNKLSHCRIRPAELSVWTGINGHGKSMLLQQALILGSAILDIKSCICSLEMKGDKSVSRLVRQITGKKEPSRSEIISAMEWLESRCVLVDLIGVGNIDKLLNDFNHAVADGVKVFVIDSLMCLGIKEDDHTAQKNAVHQLQLWAQQNNVHLALVAHSRKGSSEADKPGKLDVLGSSHITNMADCVWSVWRNKGKEAKVNEHRSQKQAVPQPLLMEYDAVIECSKSREGDDEERMYGLYYDRASLQYRDEYDAPVMPLNEVLPF